MRRARKPIRTKAARAQAGPYESAAKIIELSKQALACIEQHTTENGVQVYSLKDTAPEWVKKLWLALTKEGQIAPSQLVCGEIFAALTYLSHVSGACTTRKLRHELTGWFPNMERNELVNWLAADPDHAEFVDEVFNTWKLGNTARLKNYLQCAHVYWTNSVHLTVLYALKAFAEQLEFEQAA